MKYVVKLASVAILGLALLNLQSGWLGAQPPAAPAKLPACPSAGTYTVDVDGAPNKGNCRPFIDQAQPVSFNIPPGKLFDALELFLKQSGSRGWVPLDIMMAKICSGSSCTMGPIQTAGVSGTMPPREALERLLGGTDVTFMQDQTGTFRFPPAKDAVAGGRCNWKKQPLNACPTG